jgi:O-antigen/teichoic acid export membrane protein
MIMPIITTPYLARTLGATGTGTYSYTISIVTYFILFGSLGLAMYGQREIAYVQEDVKKRSKIFYELVILRFITMSISMILFYIVYGRTGEYAIYYRILLLEMLANCIDISWFFQGIENFKKTATRNIIVKIMSVISIFLFIKNENDVVKYLLIYVLTTLIGNVTLWIGVKKYITKINIKELKVFSQLKPTIELFIPQVAIQIYTVLDKTMLGSILGDMAEVGYYEQTQKIVKILLTIITSLGTVMMPRIAKCYADGEHKQIQNYMNKTFRFVYMLAFPLIFGIIAVSDNFVPLFFGEGYDKVKLLMKVMSLIILFIGLSNIIGSQYLLSTKKQRQFTISVACGAIVNAIFNFILIRYFESLGAVIATVIAELTVTLMQFYFIREEFNIVDIIKLSRNYFISALIMFVITIIIDIIIKSDIKGIVLQVLIGGLIYFAILLAKKDSLLLELKQKVLSKIQKGDEI